MPSWAVRLESKAEPAQSASSLTRILRERDPAIVGRIEQDAVILDLRTVRPDDDAILGSALRALLD